MNLLGVMSFAVLLWWAYRHSALCLRMSQRDYLNRFALISLALLALWGIRTGINDSLEIHFLALTVLTLMLGWRTALCAATLVQISLLIIGLDSFDHAAALFWLGIAAPVLASFGWLILCHNLLPKNFWVYVFVGGFFNAMLVITLRTGLLALWYSGEYGWPNIVDSYLLLLPLMVFPEAMLNGLATVLLVVYKPEWLATWNERQYLFKNNAR